MDRNCLPISFLISHPQPDWHKGLGLFIFETSLLVILFLFSPSFLEREMLAHYLRTFI